MRAKLTAAIRSASGVSAIEYAMIASLIALSIFVGAQQIGGSVSGFFGAIAGAM